MNSKFLRVLVILIQILITAVEMGICIFGMTIVETTTESYPFIFAVIRVAVILLMTLAYYKTSVSKINPGNIFVIFFLYFLTVSELSILAYFTTISGRSFIPPRLLVRILIESQFMVQFSILGNALQYQVNEHSSAFRLFFAGLFSVSFLTYIIPATQEVTKLWDVMAPLSILSILAFLAVLSQLILAVSETTKVGALKHTAMVLLLAGNFIATVFDGLLPFSAIGTAFFFIGGIVIMLITLRNSVIL